MSSSTQNELQSEQTDTNVGVAIIEPPPEFIGLVDRTALLAAYEGQEYETKMRSCNLEKPSLGLNFLTSSDPHHAYYQKKLAEYRTQIKDEQPPSPPKRPPLSEYNLVPYKFTSPPEGITGKELDYIRLTAMFVARYGMYFLGELLSSVEEPLLQFLEVSDSRFEYFSQLSSAYSRVLKRSSEPEICRETLVDDFLRLLQAQSLPEKPLEMATIDLHALEYVASVWDREMPPPGYLPPVIPYASRFMPAKPAMSPP